MVLLANVGGGARVSVVLLALLLCAHGAAAANRWTFLVYMLADNDLECFGISDMLEMQKGMMVEPPSGCSTTVCGGSCPSGTTQLSKTDCDGGASSTLRCCPTSAYPDVLVFIDRGFNPCPFRRTAGVDYSIFDTTWTTAKEILVLPGGKWQVVRDYGEVDMSDPAILAAFLRRALVRFQPAYDRKYFLDFWDHGSGWQGYGVDHTCQANAAYSESGCDMFNLAEMATGLREGLGSNTIDIMGFDACLMAMFEVGTILAPYAKTLLASELLEPGHGWDYQAIGETLLASELLEPGHGWDYQAIGQVVNNAGGRDEAMDVANFFINSHDDAVDVANYFINYFKESATLYRTTGISLSLFDLTSYSDFSSGMSALATALRSELSATPSVAVTILQQRSQMATIPDQTSNVDLGDALKHLLSATTSSKPAITTMQGIYNADMLAFGTDNSLPGTSNVHLGDALTHLLSATTSSNSAIKTMQGIYNADMLAFGTDNSLPGLNQISKSAIATIQGIYNADMLAFGTDNSLPGISNSAIKTMQGIYNADMLAFGTDNSLPGATGVALYFPGGKGEYSSSFKRFAEAEGASIKSWADFLTALFNGGDVAVADLVSDNAGVSYSFTAPTFTPYFSYVQEAYIASGTLTIPLGKEAYAFFGFKDPTRSFWILAGDVNGQINGLQASVRLRGQINGLEASAAWDGRFWALQQVVSAPIQGGPTSSSFSFMYASEEHTYDSAGGLATLTITSLVFYGRSCTTPIKDMEKGMLKYRYIPSTGAYKMQLYTETSAGAFGEISTETGGVILPYMYKVPIDFSTSQVNSYELSSCIKWGYPESLQVLPLTVSEASTLLGDNIQDNLLLFLQSSSVDDRIVALPGVFSASTTFTVAGCQCQRAWKHGERTYYGCDLPDDDPGGPWCFYEVGSCEVDSSPNSSLTDYCGVKTTLSGCDCLDTWTYQGLTFGGVCANPDNDPLGAWCFVDNKTCPGVFRAHAMDADDPRGRHSTVIPSSPCILPTTYNGVPMYDCLTYNHSTPGVATDAWCYTGVRANETVAKCHIETACTPLALPTCPSDASADLDLWVDSACLTKLCEMKTVATGDASARLPGSLSVCEADATFVNQERYKSDSLASVCEILAGTDCIKAMLAACPALSIGATSYNLNSVEANVCLEDCITTICQASNTNCFMSTSTNLLILAMNSAYDAVCSNTIASCPTSTNLLILAMNTAFDAVCGSNTNFNLPGFKMCPGLLAAPPTCATSTLKSSVTSGTIYGFSAITPSSSDPPPLTLSQFQDAASNTPVLYAPFSTCNWTISKDGDAYVTLNLSSINTEHHYDLVTDGDAYVTLNFSSINTEHHYDLVTVRDGRGLLGILSGSGSAVTETSFSTDTGSIEIEFTSDEDIESSGFTATYSTTSVSPTKIPSCTSAANPHLLKATLSTFSNGGECSWALVESVVANIGSSAATNVVQREFVMSGGILPPVVYACSTDPTGGILPPVVYVRITDPTGGILPPVVYVRITDPTGVNDPEKAQSYYSNKDHCITHVCVTVPPYHASV
eukprot:gene16534-22762_t